jgi:hypothetical protein
MTAGAAKFEISFGRQRKLDSRENPKLILGCHSCFPTGAKGRRKAFMRLFASLAIPPIATALPGILIVLHSPRSAIFPILTLPIPLNILGGVSTARVHRNLVTGIGFRLSNETAFYAIPFGYTISDLIFGKG